MLKVVVKKGKYWYKNGMWFVCDMGVFNMKNGKVLDERGNCFWYKKGKLHREERDAEGFLLPALIYRNGTKQWGTGGEDPT